MNDTTHPITLPWRDDAAPNGDNLRSIPGCAVPAPLSFGDEPFADSLLAQARAERLHASKVAFAKHAEERKPADRRRKSQQNKAHARGMARGRAKVHTRGRYWGLLRGAVQWLWHFRKPA